MSKKYSDELKLKIVLEYDKGPLGAKLLAKKYDISSHSLIHTWINQYKEFGKEGLQTKKTKRKYPLNFKLNVLRFKQDTGASYRETANAFGITESSIIANWKRDYLKEGTAGLNKPIGRPPKMTKSNSKKIRELQNNIEKNSTSEDEIELLKKENEYLKIELEYLKKLKARGLKDPRENNNQN
ncbi:MAG: helix-turn-helix domain-containing protein [Alkalibacterium sp.]|nr:helix-turn-helix domain-containing protein [Alkalibacterium sp.]MDN6363789.1 helix-turn-helix domain-containing protein [Tetragenococcus koreensis]MDN6398824.1 helix-turn-helix domain-containing protein [Alkalibacterium sp.]